MSWKNVQYENGKFKTGEGGGGGGSSTLAGLDDVNLSSPSDGQILIYNATSNKWVNGGIGHNYSTTEQVIGTWIDGKPLYEKVVTATITSGTQWIDTNIESTALLKKYGGILYETGGNVLSIPSADPSEQAGFNVAVVGVVTSGKWSILFRTNATSARGNLEVTIQYTKTSDA